MNRTQIYNIISSTYGRGAMVDGLTDQVEKFLSTSTDKRKLTNLIWEWMPGGDTAFYCAGRLLDNE